MAGCAQSTSSADEAADRCPECGRPGRRLPPITLKALLRPEALARLAAVEHRFCPGSSCDVVYFGPGQRFRRGDVRVPVFQKEAAGERTVCYCFAVSEGDIRREIEGSGRSAAAEHIALLVKAERCACEVRNPQGTCCLGNVAAVAKASRGGQR